MKLWFEIDYNYIDKTWLGVGGFKHSKDHKWKGWTINIYLVTYMIIINWVSDWKEYDKKINYRRYIK